MMKQHFKNIYEYEFWANKTLIEALLPLDEMPPRAEALMAHILLAQRIWYGRFTGDLYQGSVWDSIDRAEWLPTLSNNIAALQQVIDTLDTPAQFEQTTTYTNMQGLQFTNTFYDILSHMSHHAHYHRGQIVQLCRPRWSVAPATDYIVYARIKAGQL